MLIPIRKLTDAAERDRHAFNSIYEDAGCRCHLTPPCDFCTHPGNPLSQEDDDCYEPSLVYLAVPYSDPSETVRRLRFNNSAIAAGHLFSLGYFVFSPITHSHPIAESNYKLDVGFTQWERYDLTMLSMCDGLIVSTQLGWDKSIGVGKEIAFAVLNNIPVNYLNLDPKTFTLTIDEYPNG